MIRIGADSLAKHRLGTLPTAGAHLLPLSVNVLFEDLLTAVDLYEASIRQQDVAGEPEFLRNYGATMEALMEPENTDLFW